MPTPDDRFARQLASLRATRTADRDVACALRLSQAEAERLGLRHPQPWSHLAWRIEANRVRWRRKHWR